MDRDGKRVVNGEAQLSDGAGSFVSGCYDLLSENDKKDSLVKSYESYHIEDSDYLPEMYTDMLRNLDNKTGGRLLNRDSNSVSRTDPDADTVFNMPRRVTN